jgi:hypothetical protein
MLTVLNGTTSGSGTNANDCAVLRIEGHNCNLDPYGSFARIERQHGR